MQWCERRILQNDHENNPEIINSISSLAISISAFFLCCKFPNLYDETFVLFCLGIFSFAFHFQPCEFTRLLDEGTIVAYKHLVFSKVLELKFSNHLTAISVLCLLFTGKFHCLCLIFEALAIYYITPTNEIFLRKKTKILCVLAIFFWSLDFRCNENFFHFYNITPHCIWHVIGAFASYCATKDLFL
jgi:hypothetical protein